MQDKRCDWHCPLRSGFAVPNVRSSSAAGVGGKGAGYFFLPHV